MSDDPNAYKYAKLFSKAWSDPAVMSDLTSGDQAKIRAQFDSVGIEYDEDVSVHIHQGSKTDRHVVMPPKAYIDSGSDDPAGKCYGPMCLVLTGPF